MKRLLTLLPVCLVFGSCAPAVDPTFGANYDACILKNTKGLLEAASTAEICARHFERDATPAESNEITKNSRVRTYYFNPVTINGSFTNSSDDLIVTAEQIEANYWSDGPIRSQAEAEALFKTPPVYSLNWTFKTTVNPGRSAELVGVFQDGKPPTARSDGKITILKVISRTGK